MFPLQFQVRFLQNLCACVQPSPFPFLDCSLDDSQRFLMICVCLSDNTVFFWCFGLARTWRLCLRMSQSCWIATSKWFSSFSLSCPNIPHFTRSEIPAISLILFNDSFGNGFGIVLGRPVQILVKFGEDLVKFSLGKLENRG